MKKSANYDSLYRAMLTLQNEEEVAAFFEDLFTISELNAAAQRLQVARMLRKGKTCACIAQETGASTATVSRVNKCLQYGAEGYTRVLERLEEKE